MCSFAKVQSYCIAAIAARLRCASAFSFLVLEISNCVLAASNNLFCASEPISSCLASWM